MRARPQLVSALVVVGLLLSGCQKPSPGVTMVSGGHSVRTTAINYCRDGRYLTQTRGNECPSDGKHANVLYVRQGDSIGIDVDKALAKTGWTVVDVDLNQPYGFQTGHYQSIVADFANRPIKGIINLEVREPQHVPTSDTDLPKIIGQWEFQIAEK